MDLTDTVIEFAQSIPPSVVYTLTGAILALVIRAPILRLVENAKALREKLKDYRYRTTGKPFHRDGKLWHYLKWVDTTGGKNRTVTSLEEIKQISHSPDALPFPEDFSAVTLAAAQKEVVEFFAPRVSDLGLAACHSGLLNDIASGQAYAKPMVKVEDLAPVMERIHFNEQAIKRPSQVPPKKQKIVARKTKRAAR